MAVVRRPRECPQGGRSSISGWWAPAVGLDGWARDLARPSLPSCVFGGGLLKRGSADGPRCPSRELGCLVAGQACDVGQPDPRFDSEAPRTAKTSALRPGRELTSLR
jgi:hypothetical protein